MEKEFEKFRVEQDKKFESDFDREDNLSTRTRWKLNGVELTEDELQRIDPNEAYELIALEAICG